MKAFIVKAEHFAVPGVPAKAFLDAPAADAEALELVNMIRADLDLPAATGEWRPALIEAQLHRIAGEFDEQTRDELAADDTADLAEAADCDVWIEEYDVLGDTPPAVIDASRAVISAFGGDVPDYLQAEIGTLENALAEARPSVPAQPPVPVTLVVNMTGGCLQGASSNFPVDLFVLDYEARGYGDEDQEARMFDIPNNGEAEVLQDSAVVDPAFVRSVVETVNAGDEDELDVPLADETCSKCGTDLNSPSAAGAEDGVCGECIDSGAPAAAGNEGKSE